MSTELVAAPPQQRRLVAVATFIGSVVEWYDFFIYGTAAALVLNTLFFPEFDRVVGTLLAFVTFAVGWLARPIGGIVAGHLGDRIGRKTMLMVTMVSMGTATVLVGLLPTYNQIGVVAPVLLLVFRLIQGLAVGGEYGGSVVMALENAPRGRRGLWAGLTQSGVPFGLFLGTVAYTAVEHLPAGAFLAWGWRLPFLTSSVLIVIGILVRFRITESKVFEKVQEQEKVTRVPALEVLRQYPGREVLMLLAHMAPNTFFYTFAVYLLTYATTQAHFTGSQVLTSLAVAAAVETVTIPLFAAWSDRIGRKRLYVGGMIALGVLAFPFFLAVNTGSPLLLTVALVVALGGAHAAMYGPQASLFGELFPTAIRYSGLSMGYQIAGSIFGGPLPIIATLLVAVAGGQVWIFAAFLVLTAIVSAVAGAFLPENRSDDIDAVGAPRTSKGQQPVLAEHTA
ncbi:MAG: Major Facilitator Superfamily [Frondihabitans sp.]|nr:Major Facilitator Superfamily [Frondihabitans sp.]